MFDGHGGSAAAEAASRYRVNIAYLLIFIFSALLSGFLGTTSFGFACYLQDASYVLFTFTGLSILLNSLCTDFS